MEAITGIIPINLSISIFVFNSQLLTVSNFKSLLSEIYDGAPWVSSYSLQMMKLISAL